MDRQTAYAGELPVVSDYLQAQQNAMVALGELVQSLCGSSTFVTGLACTPTTPTASLSVVLAPGCIYQSEPLEATNWSALNANTTYNIMKQGISLGGPSVSAFTPPATSGYSQVFLIEAQYQDSDTNSEVLPYFNPAILTTPGAVNFAGPGNNGQAQPTARLGILAVQVKAGAAAATGTQVTPAADTGWVSLYAITLTNGQTQITSSSIVVASGAPFLPSTINGAGAYVQSGAPVSVVDTGTTNALAVAPNPAPVSIPQGMQLRVKVAHLLTSASTLTVTLASGTQTNPITRADTTPTQYGDLIAGQEVDLSFDGTEWQIPRAVATGQRTTVADANYTATPLDRSIAYTSLTASRTISLPSAASYPIGVILWSFDETGNATNSKTITLAANGSDTIHTGTSSNTSVAINGSYGVIGLESNGSNGWTIIHARMQTTGRTTVADAAYTMLATDRQIAYTSITAPRTVALLPAASFPPGTLVTFRDDSSAVSATNTISAAPNGSDTINGANATTVMVNSPNGMTTLESDGVSGWRYPVTSAVDVSGMGMIAYKLTGVNFNSANSDNAITFALPPGVSRYTISAIRIAHASTSLTTATAGVFSGPGGTGTTIVTSAAVTVSASADNTANNMQTLAVAITTTTQSLNYTTLYFRVGTAEGAAATADVIIELLPL